MFIQFPMKHKDLAGFRREYGLSALDESTLPGNPLDLFGLWLDEAIRQRLPEPNAMALATVTPGGKPSARVVLLKEIDDGHFVFYSNYNSPKGKDLAATPYASLMFLWLELHRQVRVNGSVTKLPSRQSDRYFASRPRTSQISALASPQSQPIAGREVLEDKYKTLEKTYASGQIQRPSYWGGYRLDPEEIEFWQGRENRLHDRIVYIRENADWIIQRLAP